MGGVGSGIEIEMDHRERHHQADALRGRARAGSVRTVATQRDERRDVHAPEGVRSVDRGASERPPSAWRHPADRGARAS